MYWKVAESVRILCKLAGRRTGLTQDHETGCFATQANVIWSSDGVVRTVMISSEKQETNLLRQDARQLVSPR